MSVERAAGRMFLYRWRLVPGREDDFVAAWTAATQRLLAAGSLGSRLHVGDDGWWYGYAQWPDRDTRDAAFAAVPADPMAAAGAVAESAPPLELVPVVDLLQPPGATPRTS